MALSLSSQLVNVTQARLPEFLLPGTAYLACNNSVQIVIKVKTKGQFEERERENQKLDVQGRWDYQNRGSKTIVR